MNVLTMITDLPDDKTERAQRWGALEADGYELVTIYTGENGVREGYFRKKENTGGIRSFGDGK